MNCAVQLLICAVLLSAGCSRVMPQELARQVRVFGIQPGERNDIRELNGEAGTDEPCLHGYERSFEQQGVTIGYRRDGTIRRIVTRNPSTILFGISPGMGISEAVALAEKAGFAGTGGFGYRNGGLTMKLLVDEKRRLFGVILEEIE